MQRDETGSKAEALVEQRERVAELAAHDERIRALEARRTDLEVDRIAAEVALRSHPHAIVDALAPGDADELLVALDRVRALEGRSSSDASFLASREQAGEGFAERMRRGITALDRWLADAESERTGAGTRIAARVILVIIALVLVVAFQVHLAFLILLVPIGGAASFMLWTGQDSEWRRIGAKREFEKLDLEPPCAWTADAVRARRAELIELRDRAADRYRGPEDDEDDAAYDALIGELAEARDALELALHTAGLELDGVDAEFEKRLRQVAALVRAERALRVVTREIAEHGAEAGAIRESVFSTLSREGAAPRDGRADTKTLAEGLERVTKGEAGTE